MSPRKRKPPTAGRAALCWRDDPAPVPLARPGWSDPIVYGWLALSFDDRIALRAVVMDGECHAVADARLDEPDPRVLLARLVKHRHQGGWSRSPVECYATVREALLALRLRRQAVYAERLALLDAAIDPKP